MKEPCTPIAFCGSAAILRAGALGALAAIAAFPLAADADIIHIDPPDYLLPVNTNPGTGLDIDGDGYPDLYFRRIDDCPSGCWTIVDAWAGGAAFHLDGFDGTRSMADGLSVGAAIGPGLVFTTSAYMAEVLGASYDDVFGAWGFPGEPMFLGVFFESGAGIHYAWLRAQTIDLPNAVVLQDYAWETQADTPIIAGAVPGPVGASVVLMGVLLAGRRRQAA
jgi:hypothetical protein